MIRLLESMQKIAILYDASQAILSTFDLDEVLNQILTIIRDYFQLQNGAVLLLDKNKSELSVKVHLGRSNLDVGYRIPLGKGLTGSAAQLKRPIYVPDVSKDPRYLNRVAETRSEVAIPLMVRDEVVGVLDFQSEQLNYFDAEMIDLLTLFSTQASLALENARLYSLERRRAEQLEAINAVARQTTAVLELPDLLGVVCNLVLDWFHVDHVAVLLAESDSLHVDAYEGRLTPIISMGAQLPPGIGLAWRALDKGRSVLENNVNRAPGYIAGFAETKSEVCVPLIFFGQKLGVLALDSAQPDAFDEDDIQPLESVADICAAAIQNVHNFANMKQLAYIDGLTGIHNRRFFEMRVLEELERASRFQGRMSVIMIDIDNFKRVNDEFGHLLGDEVLRAVSSMMKQQLRKSDVFCRYGGEEFAIILPEIGVEGALHVADKLRRQIGSHHFPGVPRSVTISCGVAEYPAHGITRDEVVAASDTALYAAKQAGRDKALSARLKTEAATLS